jgi:hypothetical protein
LKFLDGILVCIPVPANHDHKPIVMLFFFHHFTSFPKKGEKLDLLQRSNQLVQTTDSCFLHKRGDSLVDTYNNSRSPNHLFECLNFTTLTHDTMAFAKPSKGGTEGRISPPALPQLR